MTDSSQTEALSFDPKQPSRLHRALPQEVWIELTSNCNARCVYCYVSQPGYEGHNLAIDGNELADMLDAFRPQEVRLTGHGEITLLPDWVQTAQALLKRGFAVTTNTNLVKKFNDQEIDTLSRFRSLEISCDIADAEILAKLRRGVRLDRIEDSMARIVAACERDYRELPYLNIGCTLTDLTIDGLPDLVRWAVRQRAVGMEVINLERYPSPVADVPFLHPSEADPARTLARIEEARCVARELGFVFTVQQGLIDACNGALQ